MDFTQSKSPAMHGSVLGNKAGSTVDGVLLLENIIYMYNIDWQYIYICVIYIYIAKVLGYFWIARTNIKRNHWSNPEFSAKLQTTPIDGCTVVSKNVASRGRRKWAKRDGFVAFSTTTTTTPHYTPIHYTTTTPSLHYIQLHYTPLHYTALHNTLHNTATTTTQIHSTTLHYTALNYTTLHYITLHYTPLHYTTLHYTTLHYLPLHFATLHSTTVYS